MLMAGYGRKNCLKRHNVMRIRKSKFDMPNESINACMCQSAPCSSDPLDRQTLHGYGIVFSNQRMTCWLNDLYADEHRERIMDNVLHNPDLIDVQPYFMRLVLEALHKAGLFYKYALVQIRLWEKQISDCSSVMKEAWGDYSGYTYDFSHTWGAPIYQLLRKLMRFEMLKSGFREISLAPDLFVLEFAHIEMPAPYGKIIVDLKRGEAPKVQAQEDIQSIVK